MRLPLRRVPVAAAVFAGFVLGVSDARAGHEFPFYPSYYPQEITVSVDAVADAAAKLADGSLHAYVGSDPFHGRPTPASSR